MPAAAAALVLLYLAPLFFLGQDAYVLIHDNLDSNLVWYRVLVDSGLVFAPGDAVVPNLLGGLPRSAFPSELNAQVWLYMTFEPFTAYVLNQLLMRFAALGGMYLLLRNHVLAGEDPEARSIRLGTALAFALLPFWPSGGLAVAGQPLALNAYLEIRRDGGRATDWAVVALLPFYDHLVFASFFVLVALGIFAVLDALRSRRIRGRFWLAIALGAAMHGVVEYRLISLIAGGSFVSHRTRFEPELLGLAGAARKALHLLVHGQYHAPSGQAPVMIVAAAFAAVLVRRGDRTLRPLAASALAIAAIAGFHGLYHWSGFAGVQRLLSLGVGFAADRFYTLSPLLWHVCFALSLAVVVRALPHGARFASALLVLQLATAFLRSDFVQEMRGTRISFRRFFATELFAAIRREIGRPAGSYRVVSVGLHPSVAQYNGFHTADGYFPSYPLSQKIALRELMRGELAKSPSLASYFDRWGSRAYVFSAELGRSYLWDASVRREIHDLALDADAMRALGVDYLLSALPIRAPGRSGLALRRTFTHPDSAWRIHLYERADTAMGALQAHAGPNASVPTTGSAERSSRRRQRRSRPRAPRRSPRSPRRRS